MSDILLDELPSAASVAVALRSIVVETGIYPAIAP